MIFKLNQKIDLLQSDYDLLQSDYNYLSDMIAERDLMSAPLTVKEVETFQHNLDVLTEFYGIPSNRPTAIAEQCYTLKRRRQMESSWITSVTEHKIPENSYYCIEIITEDEQHYWFDFRYETSEICAIHKGESKDTLLYAVVP